MSRPTEHALLLPAWGQGVGEDASGCGVERRRRPGGPESERMRELTAENSF